MARLSTRCGAVAFLVLAACTPLAEGTQEAGHDFTSAMHDNIDAWSGLFDYTPRDKRPMLPQTRYCYQMQSDIVCYDSPQQHMTAKLTGYQDGRAVSWVQPGGGSLGVSGGEPTAPSEAVTVQVAPSVGKVVSPVQTFSTASETSPTSPPTHEDATMHTDITMHETPFATGESVYIKP